MARKAAVRVEATPVFKVKDPLLFSSNCFKVSRSSRARTSKNTPSGGQKDTRGERDFTTGSVSERSELKTAIKRNMTVVLPSQ